MSIKHTSLPIDKAYEAVCAAFVEHNLEASFRFDLSVEKDKNTGFKIICRTLPASADYLNDDTRLSGVDVGAISIFSVSSSTFIFPDSLADLRAILPCAPILFTESCITMAEYRQIIIDVFPAIMLRIRLFADYTFSSALVYLKDTKAKSGNEHRYSHLPAVFAKKNPQPVLDISSGSARISKYGSKFNLRTYCPVIPLYNLNFISLRMATTSWGSYKTAWESYFDFTKHCGHGIYLPASADTLGRYANYLKSWRNLRSSSIRSYLSGVKKLHSLNRLPTGQFQDELLLDYLKGSIYIFLEFKLF